MSHQPKPATGDPEPNLTRYLQKHGHNPPATGEAEPIRVGPSWVTCEKCGEEYNTSSIHVCPKPAEWTADYVADRFTIDASSAGQIADAHNAALAAETRKKQEAIAARADWERLYLHWKMQWQESQKQLAAEREKFDNMMTAISHGLQQQLKRFNTTQPKPEVCKELERMRRELALPEIQQLRAQLDAEREKVQTLVDALTDIRDRGTELGHYALSQLADDALAKVK